MSKLAEYAKAVTGTLVSAIGITAAVVVQLNVHETWATVVVAVAAVLAAGGGVAAVPNKPKGDAAA